MSIVKLTYIYCDGNGPECIAPGEAADNAPAPGETASQQRKRLRREGWTVRNGRDYCRACKGGSDGV